MDTRTFIIATIVVIIGSALISTSNCTPVLTEREERSNNVETSSLAEATKASNGQLQNRQGRYYMGYPMMGGMGYGGAAASASASASASSGGMGMGMGYGGYPYYGK